MNVYIIIYDFYLWFFYFILYKILSFYMWECSSFFFLFDDLFEINLGKNEEFFSSLSIILCVLKSLFKRFSSLSLSLSSHSFNHYFQFYIYPSLIQLSSTSIIIGFDFVQIAYMYVCFQSLLAVSSLTAIIIRFFLFLHPLTRFHIILSNGAHFIRIDSYHYQQSMAGIVKHTVCLSAKWICKIKRKKKLNLVIKFYAREI